LLSLLFSVGWIYENKKVDIFCGINLVLSTVLLLVVKNFSSWFVVIMFLLVICIKNFFVLVFVLCSLIITGVVVNPVSFFDRLTWFTIGWRMWNDNFLFGVGLGNFKWFYPQYVINVPFLPSMGTIFAHNYFIQMSAETGVVWLMLFFLMIYLVLRSSLVLKDVKGINKRYFLPLCGILLQNTVDYNLLIPQNNILFFIFLSLLISDIENIENRKFQQLKMNKNLYFLLIIFLCSYSVLVSIKMEKIVRLLTTGSETNMMKVITEDKTCWYGYKQLGLFAFQKGEIKKAQQMLLKTIQNNPVEAESHFYLSMINFKLGDKKVAYKFLSNAVKLNPRNADKYVKLFKKWQKLK
ncbi:MAG: hypothetical protein NZ839_00785, partial [Endomicrobia bacterium]|nr:hypothetical protein [Endomicrobiia bacterium]